MNEIDNLEMAAELLVAAVKTLADAITYVPATMVDDVRNLKAETQALADGLDTRIRARAR
jgi:hypothetical protein